jgi:hypothetical protein
MSGSEIVFSPPLKLEPRVVVQTLREASGYARTRLSVRRPFIMAGVLRSMSAALTADQQHAAAKGFRLWAEAEGLVLGDQQPNPSPGALGMRHEQI